MVFDKMKDLASGHEEQVDGAIDKGGDAVETKTDGRLPGIDEGGSRLKDMVGSNDSDAPDGPDDDVAAAGGSPGSGQV